MNWWVRSTERVVQNLIYIEHLLILTSAVIGCVSISTFSSFASIPIDSTC